MQGIGVVPHGGFSYEDSQVPFHEESGLAEIITWLQGYRIANGIQIGTPEADVLAYIAKKQYRPTEPGAFQAPPAVPQTLRDRVTNWLSQRFHLARTTVQLVDPETAAARAAICSNCPENQNWKHGCPPCIANNERVVLLLTQGRTSNGLQGCNVTGQENNAAVNLAKEHLDLSQVTKTIPQCWMRELAILLLVTHLWTPLPLRETEQGRDWAATAVELPSA